ncbi:polysaccharide pyruvyl transferase family protein, partial [uncultured Clostridium sp.]|uniref:polysaccharide pyruvyl transferase family protein n=1 Tax=uncultured Clostridium sp. TaxID=59620 RepID=UPI0025DD25A1
LSGKSINKIKHIGAFERFRHLCSLKNYTIENAIRSCLNYKYDISILCNWSMPNYGAHLTHYALYKVISDLGLEALMVERIPSYYGKSLSIPPLFRINPYPIWALHKPFDSKTDALAINKISDIFLVGSDQNWNRYMSQAVGDFWFLNFIHNNKRKISYAASFGFDTYDRYIEECKRTAYYLKKFDAVSVREKSGVDICKKYFNTKAEWVLDPVFLCKMDYYNELISHSSKCICYKYVFMYILDIGDKEDVLEKISSKLNLQSINVTDAYDKNLKLKNWTLPVEEDVLVEDWLNYIKNSNFVITDSYHGVCFSILFRKQFIAIVNKDRGGARFTSLLSLLNLEDRAVNNIKEAVDKLDYLKEINYNSVNKILNAKREQSLRWLKDAIFTKAEKTISDVDILNERCDDIEISKERINNHIERIDIRTENIDKHVSELDVHTVNIDKHVSELDTYTINIDSHVSRLDTYVVNIDKHVYSIEEYITNMNEEIVRLREELECIKKDNDIVKKSFSYKIGKTITYIPRNIVNKIKIIKRRK